jgi:hypothetical protein
MMMGERVKGKKRVKRRKRVKRKEREENERKTKKQASFYAKASDVKSTFYTNLPMFVLLYKEACFNTTELANLCLVLLSLCCRNMRTCFLTMCLVDCHLLEE